MFFVICPERLIFSLDFFFNDTATTEIYTLSLHDALPISPRRRWHIRRTGHRRLPPFHNSSSRLPIRSEEHTSELQSPCNLVCRLLLEKKKKQQLKRFLFKTKKNEYSTQT